MSTSTPELDELVASFAQAAARHYAFTQEGQRRNINREADKIDELYRRIKGYGDPGKQGLLKLLGSSDLAVSSMAAAYCMHFAPRECRQALEAAAKDRGLLGLEAKYALKRFDDESWRAEFP